MSNITTKKKVDILVNTATSDFFEEEKAKRIKNIKAKIAEYKKAYKELKNLITERTYEDKEAVSNTEQLARNIGENEIPSIEISINSKENETKAIFQREEAYKKSIIIINEKIESLKSKITKLEEIAKNMSGKSLDLILNQIQNYYNEITVLDEEIKDLETKISLTTIEYCQLQSELENLNTELAILRKQYVTERKKVKTNEIIDDTLKTIDQSTLLDFELKLQELEEKLEFYSLNAITLGEEIKSLLDKNSNDQELEEKLELLTRLANAFYEIPNQKKYYGIKNLNTELTAGELRDQIANTNEILNQYHFATVQKETDIDSLTGIITSYKVQICTYMTIVNKIDTELSLCTEKDHEKKLKSTKRDIEIAIKELKNLTNEKEEELVEYLSYISELRRSRSEKQLNVIRTSIEVGLSESGQKELMTQQAMAKEFLKSLSNDVASEPIKLLDEIKEELIIKETPELIAETYDLNSVGEQIVEEALPEDKIDKEIEEELDTQKLQAKEATETISDSVNTMKSSLTEIEAYPTELKVNLEDLEETVPEEKKEEEHVDEQIFETPMEEEQITEIPILPITSSPAISEILTNENFVEKEETSIIKDVIEPINSIKEEAIPTIDNISELVVPIIEEPKVVTEGTSTMVDIESYLARLDKKVVKRNSVKLTNASVLSDNLIKSYQDKSKILVLEA